MPTPGTSVPRPGLGRRRTPAAWVALLVSLAFVMPAALFGPASTAAASLRSAQANDLPTDAISVRIDMQEADGDFTIASAADPGVSVNYPGGQLRP